MAATKLAVWHFPSAGGSTQIADAYSARTNNSMQERVSRFDFNVRNINSSYSGTFSLGDRVKIQVGHGHAGSLLINGKVTGTNDESWPTQDLKITCNTANSVLVTRKVTDFYKNNSTPDFSAVNDEDGNALSADGTGLGSSILTSSRIVRNLLRQFALGPSGTELFDANLIHYPNWNAGSGYGVQATSTQIVDDQGNDREIVFNWETIMEAILKVSDKEYAGVDHSFYIDDNWNIVWRPIEELTVQTSLKSGVHFQRANFKYKITQLKNFFVINAGRDLDDSQDILVFVYDISSIADVGFREEFVKDTATRDTIKDDLTYAGDNTGFIDAVTKSVKKTYQADLIKHSQIKWQGTVQIRGTTTYNMGQKVGITHGQYWNEEKLFIIKAVRNTLDSGGWITQLDVEAVDFIR